LGPGDLGLVAPNANQSIGDLQRLGCITVIILDLLGELSEGKTFHNLPLGEEIGRASSCVEFGRAR